VAIGIAGGITLATAGDMAAQDIVAGDSAGRIDLNDAVRAARKAAGLD
jgi:hypothetical protein